MWMNTFSPKSPQENRSSNGRLFQHVAANAYMAHLISNKDNWGLCRLWFFRLAFARLHSYVKIVQFLVQLCSQLIQLRSVLQRYVNQLGLVALEAVNTSEWNLLRRSIAEIASATGGNQKSCRHVQCLIPILYALSYIHFDTAIFGQDSTVKSQPKKCTQKPWLICRHNFKPNSRLRPPWHPKTEAAHPELPEQKPPRPPRIELLQNILHRWLANLPWCQTARHLEALATWRGGSGVALWRVVVDKKEASAHIVQKYSWYSVCLKYHHLVSCKWWNFGNSKELRLWQICCLFQMGLFLLDLFAGVCHHLQARDEWRLRAQTGQILKVHKLSSWSPRWLKVIYIYIINIYALLY